MINTLAAFFSILNVGTEVPVSFEKRNGLAYRKTPLIKNQIIPRNRHRRSGYKTFKSN